ATTILYSGSLQVFSSFPSATLSYLSAPLPSQVINSRSQHSSAQSLRMYRSLSIPIPKNHNFPPFRLQNRPNLTFPRKCHSPLCLHQMRQLKHYRVICILTLQCCFTSELTILN